MSPVPAPAVHDLDEKEVDKLSGSVPAYAQDASFDSTLRLDPPPSYDHTHRKLQNRHVQLIGIGG